MWFTNVTCSTKSVVNVLWGGSLNFFFFLFLLFFFLPYQRKVPIHKMGTFPVTLIIGNVGNEKLIRVQLEKVGKGDGRLLGHYLPWPMTA